MINQKSLNNLKPKTKTKQVVKLTLLPITIKFLKGITGKGNMSGQVDQLVSKTLKGHLLSERKIEALTETITFLENKKDTSLTETISILKKILPTG